jgi:hypothetical protein
MIYPKQKARITAMMAAIRKDLRHSSTCDLVYTGISLYLADIFHLRCKKKETGFLGENPPPVALLKIGR